jgi:NADH:ubiquinone oxidoreductase subunit 3 (subunit A)
MWRRRLPSLLQLVQVLFCLKRVCVSKPFGVTSRRKDFAGIRKKVLVSLLSMSFLYLEFSKIGILFCFSFFLASFILFLSYRVSMTNPDVEKLSAYECGFDPYEDARNVFDVRFYLVAILFIIFDLEAVYFFPWSVSLSFLSLDSFWGMIDFILELVVGFVYAWEVGALEWE